MKCKVSNKIIKPFMSFGKMLLSNGFLKKEDFEYVSVMPMSGPDQNRLSTVVNYLRNFIRQIKIVRKENYFIIDSKMRVVQAIP